MDALARTEQGIRGALYQTQTWPIDGLINYGVDI